MWIKYKWTGMFLILRETKCQLVMNCVHTRALMHTKTKAKAYGFVTFMLFIKMNLKVVGVFHWCSVVVCKAYSYAEGYYITFQRLETDNRQICVVYTSIK